VIVDISKLSQLDDFAQSFSQSLKKGDIIYLQGDLGSGKTTFTQMLLKCLSYSGRVKSPTYAIYESYELDDFNLIHMDLYRIGSAEELYYLALDEIFDGDNVVIIEWPDMGRGTLLKATKTLSFELVNAVKRHLMLHIT